MAQIEKLENSITELKLKLKGIDESSYTHPGGKLKIYSGYSNSENKTFGELITIDLCTLNKYSYIKKHFLLTIKEMLEIQLIEERKNLKMYIKDLMDN